MKEEKEPLRRRRRTEKEAALSRKIRHYGGNILQSEAFRKGFSQTHHLHGSVSDHSLNVCIASARIGRLCQKLGIRVNEKELIQAALCHDLGMLAREEKYAGRRDSWRSHPEDSARIARELVPDLSPSAAEIIRTHMWPVSGRFPRSREGLILTSADKYASLADWASWVGKRRYKARLKSLILKEREKDDGDRNEE